MITHYLPAGDYFVASNGLTIANKGADIEFTDGVDVNGFKLTQDRWMTEIRGNAFVGQVSSGGSNYQDAEPWKRKVYDNFLGGFGQLSDNKVTGGIGIGGDDTKFFYADAKTDRSGYLLPGMARNLIYNTITAAKIPVQGDSNPVAGDEFEVPRGIVPCALSNAYATHNTFTTSLSGFTGITNLRVLINLQNTSLFNYTVRAKVYAAGSLVATFSLDLQPQLNYPQYNGWCWINLVSGAVNFAASTTHHIYFDCDSTVTPSVAAIGCYIGQASNSYGNANNINAIRPYFQICKPATATPYKWFSSAMRKVEQLYDTATSTYFNVAILNTSYFNVAATSTVGSSAGSPEQSFVYPYLSSIVFNNNLYISWNDGGVNLGLWMVLPANAKVNGSFLAGNATTAFTMKSPVAYGGYIYFFERTGRQMYKWTGNFPATGADAPIQITAAGTIGQSLIGINKLFVFNGNFFVTKPEGIYQLYIDPAVMDTQPGNSPRIIEIQGAFPTYHPSNGLFVVQLNGAFYVNYKDRVLMFTPGTIGFQITPLVVPMPWYRLGYYHQVDGITTDGTSLYVSYNNLGVFQYINQTWHVVSEIYETIIAEPTISGLTWVNNPTGGCDNLYFRDSFSLVQIPIPNAASPYTRQFYQDSQNKCGYFISSGTNMEQAEIVKYVQSAVLAAVPSSCCFMVRPVVFIPGVAATDPYPGFSNILNVSWQNGLVRDSWMTPTALTTSAANGDVVLAATQKYIAGGTLKANTVAPTCWVPNDFASAFYSSEKLTYQVDTSLTIPEQELLTNPAKFVQVAFIIYFWNPVLGQATTVGQDIMAIDSLVVKYQAVQDYLAQYQCTLDFHAMQTGTGPLALSKQQIEDSYDWLRSQTGRHSPLRVTFRVRKTGTTTRSLYFLPQNPSWISDPTVANVAEGDTHISTVGIQMIATQSEYPNV